MATFEDSVTIITRAMPARIMQGLSVTRRKITIEVHDTLHSLLKKGNYMAVHDEDRGQLHKLCFVRQCGVR